MSHTSGNVPSVEDVNEAGNKSILKDNEAKNAIGKTGHYASWVVGILFSLLPVGGCAFFGWLYSSNAVVSTGYRDFIAEFVSSGSFLWVSITLLAMSLLDLLLYGLKKEKKDSLFYKMFILLSIIFVFLGVFVYFQNIASPIDENKMKLLSGILFVLYGVGSGIISFKMVQEV